jgi:transcriptional regulator with XRE-family HTH domain
VAGAFDLCGVLRRIRRNADLSQRELAAAAGLSASAVAHAEAGSRDLPVGGLVRAAALAGLRLVLLDETGHEVAGMAAGAVRDRGRRRYPAHLDVRYSDQGWWAEFDRYTLVQPWYTFDRVRWSRDWLRREWGTPADHLLPGPDDSPAGRMRRRAESARRRRREERERLGIATEAWEPLDFVCTCPPECDELDDRSGKPVHAEECPCGCDVA